MKEEKEKKSYLGLIIIACIIVVTSISVAVYFCFHQKNANDVQKKDSKEGKESQIIFYKGNKEISSFNCDGKCFMFFFGDYPDENSEAKKTVYKYKTFEDDKAVEQSIDLENSDFVLIGYCQEGICEEISRYDYAEPTFLENNTGIVVLFNVKTGKYVEYKGINSIKYFDSTTYILSKSKVNSNETNNILVFSDGTSRNANNEFVNDWCWEGSCTFLTYGDSVISLNSNGKYGIENIKTGKETVEHKYDNISPVNNDSYFAEPIASVNGSYIKLEENGKTNLYEYNNGLNQITQNGYEAIYFITPSILFVYSNGSFFFIDMNEKILSSKENIKVEEFERFPHEATIMFKKIDNESLYIKITPVVGKYDEETDSSIANYYIFNIETKTFKKISKDTVCKNNQEYDDFCN